MKKEWLDLGARQWLDNNTAVCIPQIGNNCELILHISLGLV